MTNSKLRKSDSAYSIYFGQVLLKMSTFLINTAEYTTFINSFSIPLLPYYKPDKQTHIHIQQQSSFNNKDMQSTH